MIDVTIDDSCERCRDLELQVEEWEDTHKDVQRRAAGLEEALKEVKRQLANLLWDVERALERA